MELLIIALIVMAFLLLGASQESQTEELIAVVRNEEPGWFAGCSGYFILAFFACCGLALLLVLGGALQ
jgi:uncharacterized membrane protein YkvI